MRSFFHHGMGPASLHPHLDAELPLDPVEYRSITAAETRGVSP